MRYDILNDYDDLKITIGNEVVVGNTPLDWVILTLSETLLKMIF